MSALAELPNAARGDTPNAADLLDPAEVANLFRVSRQTVVAWAREGRLPSARIGRTLRFRRCVIEDVLSGRVPA
jgi:excisionase family DNA binding protein